MKKIYYLHCHATYSAPMRRLLSTTEHEWLQLFGYVRYYPTGRWYLRELTEDSYAD